MIGAGSTIIPGKKVGEWATVGAGATVIHDIPSFRTAIGTPAILIYEKTSIKANHG
ncbi:dTDP-3-amino-3,6-dideoxy-alpha-D-galactopyranose 3-N-acetyltransferase [compost metagenome]